MVTQAEAGRFAELALGHVTREYPHKLDHVLGGEGDLLSPRALHPVFYGSFDWHSCVHSYWLLARILRQHPDIPEAARISALFDAAFTTENVTAEVAYLARPLSRTFERPYGWAWVLKLAAELAGFEGDQERAWSAAFAPLAEAFARRFLEFLPKSPYPIRTGVHSNTAFALALANDYAKAFRDDGLAKAVGSAARRWYLADADCSAWEPSGEDFLSPCLTEAECMRRMLPTQEFAAWFDRFLPRLERREPSVLFEPVATTDRSDGKLAHLDGLNLSRAWCWRSLVDALPESDPRAAFMREAASRHLGASLSHLADDYMGEHWLASFALLALEAGGAEGDAQ